MDFFRSDKFAARVEALMKKYHVPGVAVALVHNDTVESAGFGLASIDPPIAMTPDTLLDIASASKSLTAASIGLLINDDKYPDIKYETPVSTLLPDDFVVQGDGYTEAITIEDILSHRTGIPGHDYSYLGPDAECPDDAKSVTRNLRNLATCAPMRTKWIYSNMMYTVATHLLEETTGVKFPDFLEERFFQPLGMTSSNLQVSRARAKGLGSRITKAYVWHKDRNEYLEAQVLDAPDSQGAGCIVTSVNDYVKWVKAVMNKEGPITEEVYKGMVRMRMVEDPDREDAVPQTSPNVYATGWTTYNYRGHSKIEHGGWVWGMVGNHFFLPDLKFGGMIIGNSNDGGSIAGILISELIDELIQVPEADRADWEAHFFDDDDEEEDNNDGTVDALTKQEIKLAKEIAPELAEPELQTRPLEDYIGKYWNAGYHTLQVGIKDGGLFIDASERDFGFTLKFRHVCNQTKYTVRLIMAEKQGLDEIGVLPAEFVVEDGEVVRLGVKLEYSLEELIWFERRETLPEDILEIPLQRIANQSAYGIEFHVGNPPQKAITKIDTGSPTYGFESPINPLCNRELCNYGVYNNLTSKTTTWINNTYFNQLIDKGFGSYVNDTIRLAGHTLDNINFGVVERNDGGFTFDSQQTGSFGLGAICSTKACDSYPTFLQQLYDRGAISRRAFSIYLGPNDPDAKGGLLIGGIDRAKRQGPVYKRKVLDPTSTQAESQPNSVGINGLELKLANGTVSSYTYDNVTYALWDAGLPYWFVPMDMFKKVTEYFGVRDVVLGAEIDVNCSYRKQTSDALVVDMGDGAKISVPMHHLVDRLAEDTCTISVAPSHASFGTPYLRNVYFTFDYEELTVEFAAVKYTDETDIVKIQ